MFGRSIDALGQKGLATAQGEAGEIKSQADSALKQVGGIASEAEVKLKVLPVLLRRCRCGCRCCRRWS